MDLKRDWRKKIVVIVAMMLVFGSAILVSVSARPVLEADRISTGEHQGSEQSESEETIIESEDIPLGSGNVSESQETTEVVDAKRILVADRIPSGSFTEDEVGESEVVIVESERIPLGSIGVKESEKTTEVVDAKRILEADRIPVDSIEGSE